MINRLRLTAIAIVLTGLVLGCTVASDSATRETLPDLSNQPTVEQSGDVVKQDVAQRVVALTSLSADIIEHLDRSKLVGIPGSRLLREEPRFQDVTQVSSGQNPPSLEKIVALKPDLVIGAEGFHDRTLKKLSELGITTISSKLESWQAVEDLTNNIAKAIGADATPLLQKYQTFLPENVGISPTTLVLVSRQPILAPNKNSWAGDLLVKFGINNLGAEFQGNSAISGYVTLSPEKILEANPEVILLVDTGDDILEQFKSEPFWSQLKATETNQIYVFDYYGLVNPGSLAKIAEACDRLKQLLLEVK